MVYRMTYRDLVHGTDKNSAESIKMNGFKIKGSVKESWCGPGVYFYDIKNKAWWAADRTCEKIKNETGKKVKPTVVFADILNLDSDKIFDLRIHKDLCDFENKINDILGICKMNVSNVDNEIERTIMLRSMLVSYYADRNDKQLVIGCFKQRPQEMYKKEVSFAEGLDIIFGVETIYCVKNTDIISNVRDIQ